MANPSAETGIDDADISLLLDGDAEEQEEAITFAFQKYGKQLVRYSASRAPGLSFECHEQAALQALQDLHDMARTGRFDLDRPLAGLLFTLTLRRTIDQLRRFTRIRDFQEKLDDDDHLAMRVHESLYGTDAGREWSLIASREEARSVQEQFRSLVATLPRVQQLVAQVMADALPGDLTDAELADGVFALDGKRPTVVAVRSARTQIRQKFRKILNLDSSHANS